LNIKLPSLTLSSVLESFRVQDIDVVLADIQGAEIALLKNLKTVLKKFQIRFIIISTHDMQITGRPNTHQECLRILKDAGAFVLTEHSVSESYSGDGLILASFFEEDANLSINHSYNRSKDSLFGDWESRFFHLLSDKDSEIQGLKEKLERLDKIDEMLGNVLNSKSWQLTKPFRLISKRF
jgi:hypothetical protein